MKTKTNNKNLNLTLFVLFISLLTNLTSCAQKSKSDNEVIVISKTEFNEKISDEENPQIIDVRTPAEYSNGKIEGAINYNILDGSLENNIDKLDPEKPVFVYCAAGGRSSKAAKMLKEKGFKSIIDLKGGYNAWQD